MTLVSRLRDLSRQCVSTNGIWEHDRNRVVKIAEACDGRVRFVGGKDGAVPGL